MRQHSAVEAGGTRQRRLNSLGQTEAGTLKSIENLNSKLFGEKWAGLLEPDHNCKLSRFDWYSSGSPQHEPIPLTQVLLAEFNLVFSTLPLQSTAKHTKSANSEQLLPPS